MQPPPFRRVLVANRGEIAVRVIRALRELGIESIAVYSDADAQAPHRLLADRAVAIGPAPAAESYLSIPKLLAAAREQQAAAVHPGYGFLSENPAFVRACEEAGLVFIGPGPAAMEALGGKRSGKRIAQEAGVPTVPGFDGDDGDDAKLIAAGARVGFPLLVKASAGGGGKGMRLVERAEDLPDAIAAGRREALAAFGDATMLLERRVFPARHIEVQILADLHGDVFALNERECSVQRRHQKVLEEAPSPAVDAGLREQLCDAACALARAAGYRNAGTVEFLLDAERRFYFLEVNARLQVEHPVTELTTGLDLVHLQLAIAGGARLRDLLRGRDFAPRGHAIEARICAESPEAGYLPATGRLLRVREAHGPGVRVDSAVVDGGEVSIHYDSLLAKLIVHAPDRATACRRLLQALADSVYLGIPTNVDFLRRVVASEEFLAGRLRTDLLDQHPELARGPAGPIPDEVWIAAALAQIPELQRAAAGGGGAGGGGGVGAARAEPWRELGGVRLWEADP